MDVQVSFPTFAIYKDNNYHKLIAKHSRMKGNFHPFVSLGLLDII